MPTLTFSSHALRAGAVVALAAGLAACTAEPTPGSSSSQAQSSAAPVVSSSVAVSSSVPSSSSIGPSSSSQAPASSSAAACNDNGPSFDAGKIAYEAGTCVSCHGQPSNNGMTTGGARGPIDARKTSFSGKTMAAFIADDMGGFLSNACKTSTAASQACSQNIAHYLKVATGVMSDSGSACEASSSVSSVSSAAPVSSSSAASSADPIGNMPLVVAIDVGSTSGTVVDGVQFQADKYSRGGMTNSTTDAISGTTSGALYQSERYGAFSYDVPVTASGRYTVELHFAEIYLTSTGERSFSVQIENTTVLPNLDLYSLAGHDGAYVYVAKDIQVTDGSLSINMVANIENPTLAGFAIYSNDGELDTSVPDTPPAGQKFVGNITTSGSVRSDFTRYWNQITPENEGKWGSVERTRDQYNWGPVDRIYEYARANNIPVKAHTFVWGQQSPSWINNLSAAEQRAEIEEWMRDYCTRYPDTAMIDVVNEAHPNHAPANYARNAYGNDWIAEVFKKARQFCPNAILIYNDYNFLTWQMEDIVNDVIRSALDQGVIDAVGLQAHSWNEPKRWSAAEIKERLDYITDRTGVPIYISEYDVEDLGMGDNYQREVFQEQFPVFYEHPNVVGVTLWGYVVGTTWRDGTGLIHSNGAHRPSMDWLMEYLGKQ